MRKVATLIMNGGPDAGGENICFSSMEMRQRLTIGRDCKPEIQRTAGRIATSFARKEPLPISTTIFLNDSDTFVKLKKIAGYTCRRRYRCTIALHGYFTSETLYSAPCTAEMVSPFTGSVYDPWIEYPGDPDDIPSETDPDDPSGGGAGGIGETGRYGSSGVLSLTEPISNPVVATARTPRVETVPAPSDYVLVGGAFARYEDIDPDEFNKPGVIWAPFAMPCIIDFRADFHHLKQSCGYINREYYDIQFLETTHLTYPTV